MIDPMKVFKLSNEDVKKWREVGEMTISAPNVKAPYFQGHFPNKPVLPAVAMVDLSLALLMDQVPDGLVIKNAKFLKPVSPNQKLLVKRLPVTDKRVVQWFVPNGEKVADIQACGADEAISKTRS